MAKYRFLIGLALAGSVLVAAVAAPGVEDDAQGTAVRAVSEKPAPQQLVRVQTIEAPAEIATEFGPPLRCDQDGNLYLQSENFGLSGVRKLSPKGERLATYDFRADPSVKTDFSDTSRWMVMETCTPWCSLKKSLATSSSIAGMADTNPPSSWIRAFLGPQVRWQFFPPENC